MSTTEFISVMDLTSFIVGIASMVLSIVAIVISILFYVLGRNENIEVSNRAKDIETQTKVLESLVDSLLKTSFDMIRENSSAMHNYMLATVGKTKESGRSQEDSTTKGNNIDSSSHIDTSESKK